MAAPHASEFKALKPTGTFGWMFVVMNLALIALGVLIAASAPNLVLYVVGQICLAFGFTQAFVVLHEAGHRTLFQNKRLNDGIGHVMGFLALIPYATWRPIHARHHRYTGWQDLDATTASLVPRQISWIEQKIIDFAWKFWLPLFSILYRIQNYWRIGRISKYLPKNAKFSRLYLATTVQLVLYACLLAYIGVTEILILVGPGIFLSLMAQDLLLLSQHTGMPTNLSNDHSVDPFAPSEQEEFTRSLRLPSWLSWFLLHFDAHELHHIYPAIPSYHLRRISYNPANEINLMTWLQQVKALSGTRFLFGDPDKTEPGS